MTVEVEEELDEYLKVRDWRFNSLIESGFRIDHADELSLRSSIDVDLHEADRLAKDAGPELAYEILK